VPQPNAFKVGMTIGKLKRQKSPGSDYIPVEKITKEGWIICYEIHKLINSIWNKEEMPHQWEQSITVPIYKGKTHTLVIIVILSLLSTT
jgi:hypothetical protein